MSTPSQVFQLIERFRANLPDYKSGKYNETQVRREFIDPFFKLLGWDIDNDKGYAEAYKEVVHEDAIKVGQATKAPDYSFRIGGVRKFFLEAKKPSVNLKDDTHPAYQLRRYAWSAKLPLSILTDFEEFAVYDCRVQPVKTDKAAAARIMYLTYEQYPDQWDHLVSTFSPEAIRKGAFDRFAADKKIKKGTAEVDSAFLQEIERWRDSLARNLALRNTLSQRQLNFAVQRIIDRIIFLRIAEDRGLEPYGQLRDLANAPTIYPRLMDLCRRADARYNSGLFHFQVEKGRQEEPDSLTPGLAVDDKIFKDIFKHLYYPDSPYEFSVLSADILGQVYEQFLGKVIRLSPGGHRAEVEDKPEVKKAGGVYYTPTYIVEYIVRQTVGKLVEGQKPGQVEGLKIADPACGSGSFLLGAYQYLLDWYRDRYIEDGPAKWAKGRQPRLYQSSPLPSSGRGAGGEGWKLTIAERKRILLDHIYGVDIDPQAVEVTKLSLLLRVLEDEKSLSPQLELIQERVLPDLGNNIKCGNSLIGPDFYSGGQQLALFDDEEMHRVNAFDWQAEFPTIMRAGGFDAVIGNPPYIRMESFKELKNYLKTNYASHDERSDLYAYFMERGHKLLNDNGRFGMIVSNKFLRANYGKPLRDFLNQNAIIDRIVDFAGLPVFVGATVRTVVLLTSHQSNNPHRIYYSPPLALDKFFTVATGSLSIEQAVGESMYEIVPSTLAQPVWSFAKRDAEDLLAKLQSRCQTLKEYCDGQICMGVKSGLTEAFVIDEQIRAEIIKSNSKAQEIIKPFLNGRDVRRYYIEPKNIYLIYTYHGINIEDYPAIEQHLKPFKDRLKNRATRQEWYELQQPQFKFMEYMDNPKIIFPDIAKAPRFVLDEKGYFGSNTTYFIPRRDLYLLGLLNSRLGNLYFVKTCAGLEGKTEIYLRFFGQYLEGFPVRPIDFTNPADTARHERMVALVEQMLSLHQRLAGESVPQTRTLLQRQIEATDREIDRLVYELYNLNEAEIKIVEGTS